MGDIAKKLVMASLAALLIAAAVDLARAENAPPRLAEVSAAVADRLAAET